MYFFISTTGQVLMVTTPDDPYQTVSKLKHKNAVMQGIMHGYYRMVSDTVS